MKLSTKFTTVILFLILVPLLVSGITLNVNMTQCALKENYTSLSNLAERFGRDTDDYLAQIQEEVRLISLDAAHAQALSQASQGSEDAKTTANLASVEALVKQTAVLSEYRGACLLDSSGAVVVSLSGKRIGKPYAQDGVLELLKHNDAYFSGILHTDDVKSYFFESCAIYTQDVLMGYLVVEFDTSYFSSLARNATVGKTGYIFFVDQQDFIFAHQYPERQAFAISYNNKNGFFQNLAKLRAAQSPLPTGQDLLPGEFEYDYNSQIRLHGAYYPLEPIGGYIFVVRNLDEVRGISSGTTLLANLLLLAIGLFVIAAAIIIILSVKRPSFRILRSIGSMLKESGYIYCDYEADNELGWIAEAVNLLNTDIANIMDDLKEGEKRYRTALEAVSDIVWEYDVAAQKYTFMAKDKGMLGARRVENVDIAGCPWAYAADPEAEERRDAEFKRFVSGAVRTYRTEYETRDIRGNCAWAESIATALKNKDDKIVKVIGSITDITQKKLYDMRVLHSAEYDKLTSIYNRATIERRIKDELPKCEQSALMMVDLDNFKIINDTFGHQFGDQILKFVSSSICKMVSSQDLVGRIGGDEFVVFVKQYASEQALEETANKIVAALQSGYEKEGTTYRLSGSVGVATANQFGAKSYKTLLANADFAMYSAKRKGKNKYNLFTEALYREKVKNDVVAEHLREIAHNDILTLSFEPVLCSNSDRIVRFYASVDIVIPEYSSLSRDEIYKIAAESNQQSLLLETTFRKVCQTIKAVEQTNTYHTGVAFPIPMLSLSNEAVLSILSRVTQEEGVDPKTLGFSLDPRSISAFDHSVYTFIAGLRRICTDIELLGFGGMYTSYNIVSDFNLDAVCFADDMVSKAMHSRKYLSILESIMDIARQTATACTLLFSGTQREFFKNKLSGCYYYCTEERVSARVFCKLIAEKELMMNKYECPKYKSRLLENTIMGL